MNSGGQKSILQYFQKSPNSSKSEPTPQKSMEGEATIQSKNMDAEIISISDDEEGCEVMNVEDPLEYSSSAQALQADDLEKEFLDVSTFMEVSVKYDEGNGVTYEDGENAASSVDTHKDYKLFLFMKMLHHVLDDTMYLKLFNDDDWKIIEAFTSLTGPAKRLYVRLYLRKHQWIRLSQIKYPDIDTDLQPFLRELVHKKLMLSVTALTDLRVALNLLDTNEIKECCRDLKGLSLTGSKTKESMTKAVIKHVKTSRTIQSHFGSSSSTVGLVVLNKVKRIIRDTAYCINLETCSVFTRMCLLYLPPSTHDEEAGVGLSSNMFTLLQLDEGKIKYPIYKLNKQVEVFQSRNDLIAYEQSCDLEWKILSAIEKRDSKSVIEKLLPKAKELLISVLTKECATHVRSLPSFLRCFTAGYVLNRCIFHCTSVLEQKNLRNEAVKLYKQLLAQHLFCQHYRGRWYERLVLNLDSHLKDTQGAYDWIQKALKDCDVRGGHRYSLYKRGKKLEEVVGRKLSSEIEFESVMKGLPSSKIDSAVLRKRFDSRKNVFASFENNGDFTVISVEEVVINHYKSLDYPCGIHTEGNVYRAILSLLFWDTLYLDTEDVPDAFRSPLQTFPLDLNFDNFFIRRKDIICQKLETLQRYSLDELCCELEQVWIKNYECASLFNWEKLNIEQLKEVVQCMGVLPVAKICERLLHDYRNTRSGLPDLLVWNVAQKNIKAIEVKGPGDKVSPAQALWINFLLKIGIPAEVCHVKADKS